MGRKRHASEYLADSDSVSSGVHLENAEQTRRGRKGVARMKSVGGLVLLRPIQSIAIQLGYEQPNLSLVVTDARSLSPWREIRFYENGS